MSNPPPNVIPPRNAAAPTNPTIPANATPRNHTGLPTWLVSYMNPNVPMNTTPATNATSSNGATPPITVPDHYIDLNLVWQYMSQDARRRFAEGKMSVDEQSKRHKLAVMRMRMRMHLVASSEQVLRETINIREQAQRHWRAQRVHNWVIETSRHVEAGTWITSGGPSAPRSPENPVSSPQRPLSSRGARSPSPEPPSSSPRSQLSPHSEKSKKQGKGKKETLVLLQKYR